jgi:hypothetical protein
MHDAALAEHSVYRYGQGAGQRAGAGDWSEQARAAVVAPRPQVPAAGAADGRGTAAALERQHARLASENAAKNRLCITIIFTFHNKV